MNPIPLRSWNADLDPDRRVEVTVAGSSADMLHLRYRVVPCSGLRLPAPVVAPERKDGLWHQSCAELFIGRLGNASYREFNFSPSGDWAVYDFDSYRQRATDLPIATPPVIRLHSTIGEVSIDIDLPLALLPGALADAELGLSMVLQHEDGSLAYWALAHPGDKPDFHDRRGFILRGSALQGD